MRNFRCILVTGGCGFIGGNFVRHLFRRTGFPGSVVNVDALTYAGNRAALRDVEDEFGRDRYFFRHADINDIAALEALFREFGFELVVHFAAESHVDRSISAPRAFVHTNILGTFNLLELSRRRLADGRPVHFHHVSTDEVFGSLGPEGYFTETTPYNPGNPYAAPKAAADHLVRSYGHTYGLPITVSNCSNNYGPWQLPEKFIPLMIRNAVEGKPLPVYGDGLHVRDWLHVEDHCRAVWEIVTRAAAGDTFNVGGGNRMTNLEMVDILCGKIGRLKASVCNNGCR